MANNIENQGNKNNEIIDLETVREETRVSAQEFLSEVSEDEKTNKINSEDTENMDRVDNVENIDFSKERVKKAQEAIKTLRRFTPEQIDMIREKLKNRNKKDNDFITLKDCVDIVDKFISGEVSAEQLENFGSKMSIRAYVPIMEKMSVIMRILMQHEISAVESTEIRMTELYKDIFFTIVLQTYGQVRFNEFDNEDRQLLTYDNYDKLFPLFNQFILSYCKEDYEVFMSILKDCISFNGVMTLSESMKNFDADKLDESVKANQKLVDSLKENKKMVEDLKDIMMANDEMTKKVVENVKGMVLSEVMEEGKKSLEEKKMSEENDKNNKIK